MKCEAEFYQDISRQSAGSMSFKAKEILFYELPLKWVGGKRRLLPQLRPHLSAVDGKYIEPFLGGGSVFFDVQPRESIISDVNRELIDTFAALRDGAVKVRNLYMRHRAQHSAEYYSHVRGMQPLTLHGRAARMMYLNRACFNGVYRVNAQNNFNVPMGDRTPPVIQSELFCRWERILKNAKLCAQDFEATIEMASKGDLIYADPPYVTRHPNGSFLRYNEKVFSWEDQVRLSRSLQRAKRRGVRVIVSNADHPCIRGLYQGEFQMEFLHRGSSVAACSAHRGTVSELVIYG